MRKTETSLSLQSWYSGSRKGLDTLLEHNLPWIHAHVRRRLGPLLRRKGETADYVQEAMVQFLKYGPRIQISDDGHFRALLVKIVENSLRNQHEWFTARRRAISREHPLPPDTYLCLDPPREGVKTPTQSAGRNEQEAWVRLGIELLEPESREIIVHKQWDSLSFIEIGKRLGISADAARMRYNRAVGHLADTVWKLRRGKITAVV